MIERFWTLPVWLAGWAFIAFGYFDVAGYKDSDDSDLSCQKQNGVPKMPNNNDTKMKWFFFASGTIISYYNHCFFGIFGWQYEIKFHFGVLPWTSGMYGSNIVQMTLNVRLLGTDWAAWPCESRSLFRLRLYYFYMDHGQKRHHGPCRSSPFMGHLYHIKLLNHRIWHRTSPQFSGICHYIYPQNHHWLG